MLMGTLKETLIYRHDNDANFYRYEIYKNEQASGYFAIVYAFHKVSANNTMVSGWQIIFPLVILKSSYLPNAKVECAQHFNAQCKIAVEG